MPPEVDRQLLALLWQNGERYPQQVALRERDHGIWQEYTWRDYRDQVLAFAAGLEQEGIKPADRLLVVGSNRPALYMGMLGAMALRAVPSPAYPDTPPEELLDQVRREGIRFALVEDQEQVDKLLQAQAGELALIIYDDPRGLNNYSAASLRPFADIVAKGRERLKAHPDLARELAHRPRPDDPAMLLHSSGTTSTPKGIPIRHRHILAGVENAHRAGYFEEGEIHMAYLPIAWVGDFTFSIGAALALRFSVNIPEDPEVAIRDMRAIAPTLYFSSPRAWSGLLTRIQVGIAESTRFKRWLYDRFVPFAVELERRRLEGHQPTLGERLYRGLGELLIFGPIKDHLGLGRVKRAYTAGEAIGEEVFLYFRALGVELKQFYGQTENCALAAAQPHGEVKLHTVGRPFPGVEIRIDERGEILMRGQNVFDGYDNNPDASALTLAEGWLHTGDAGYFEEDGSLVVLGRVSEVVYTANGERYIPTYIENRLKFSPYIQDVAVVGEGKPFLAAIVCIDFDAVGHWAHEHGLGYVSYADLSQKVPVYELLDKEIEHVNALLPEGLKLRRFVNLHKAFDPDDGEVTRTRKLRRGVIAEHYAPIIEALYSAQQRLDYEARITYESGEQGVMRRQLALWDVAGLPASKAA